MAWHYYDKNKVQIGPFTSSEFKELARSGTVTPETFVEAPNGRTGLAKDVRDRDGNGLPFPPKIYQSHFNNIFEVAARGTDKDVRHFVELGIDVNTGDAVGWGPLHFAAVENSNTAVFKYLIDNGANVNLPDKEGRTPLHYTDNVEVLQYLIIRGANVNVPDKSQHTPLHRAVSRKNVPIKVVECLIHYEAKVEAKDNHGFTPLFHAAGGTAANVDVLKCLIKHGANVNVEGQHGVTPLHLAAMSEFGNVDILQCLIDNKADVHAKSDFGRTPLDDANTEEKKRVLRAAMVKQPVSHAPPVRPVQVPPLTPSYQSPFTDIFEAAKKGTVEDVRYFVETKRTDVNVKLDFGHTPLFLAALTILMSRFCDTLFPKVQTLM